MAKNPVFEQSLTKQPVSSSGMQSNFYFYNAVTVAQGKINFKKKWGDIKYGDNWKTIAVTNQNQTENASEEETEEETTDKSDEDSDMIKSPPAAITEFRLTRFQFRRDRVIGELAASLELVPAGSRLSAAELAAAMIERIKSVRSQGDSVGGVIQCRVRGLPPGLGEPVFDRLEADLAKAVMSLPAARVMPGPGTTTSPP